MLCWFFSGLAIGNYKALLGRPQGGEAVLPILDFIPSHCTGLPERATVTDSGHSLLASHAHIHTCIHSVEALLPSHWDLLIKGLDWSTALCLYFCTPSPSSSPYLQSTGHKEEGHFCQCFSTVTSSNLHLTSSNPHLLHPLTLAWCRSIGEKEMEH